MKAIKRVLVRIPKKDHDWLVEEAKRQKKSVNALVCSFLKEEMSKDDADWEDEDDGLPSEEALAQEAEEEQYG